MQKELQKGYGYVFIGVNGKPHKDTWQDSEQDKYRLSTGNVHKTIAYAEKWRDKLIARTTIERSNNDFMPDWNNPEQEKWYGVYGHKTNSWVNFTARYTQCVGTIYFASRKDLETSQETNSAAWKVLSNNTLSDFDKLKSFCPAGTLVFDVIEHGNKIYQAQCRTIPGLSTATDQGINHLLYMIPDAVFTSAQVDVEYRNFHLVINEKGQIIINLDGICVIN